MAGTVVERDLVSVALSLLFLELAEHHFTRRGDGCEALAPHPSS